MTSYRTAALDYIRYVLDQTGMKPAALAKASGVAATTLTRPLNDDGHAYSLSIETLDKVRNATGYDAGPFFSKDLGAVERSIDFARDPVAYAPNEEVGNHIGTPVIGGVKAGAWLEHRFLNSEGFVFLQMTRNGDPENSFALEVHDDSIGRIAEYGDHLLCTRVRSEQYYVGMLAVVERRRERDRTVEVTARRLDGDLSGKRWFVFDTDDERYSDTLAFPSANEDEEVAIVGEVNFVVRNPLDQTALEFDRRMHRK